MSVDVSQMRALAADFHASTSEVTQGTIRVVQRTGHDTVALAQQHAAVDTGLLRSSISVEFGRGDALGFVAGPTVSYGGFVEDGTEGPYPIPNAFGHGHTVMHPGISPQPYMGPGFEQAVDQAMPALAAVAGNIL